MDKLSPQKLFRTKRINHIVLIWMLVISFSSCALLTFFTIQVQYRNFQNETNYYRERYLSEQKRALKAKVEEAVEYTLYKTQKSKERLQADIRDRVYEAWNVASHIYQLKAPHASRGEIEHLIREALRPIRFNSGRGYYFIVSMDGVEELYPTNPDLEGTDLSNLQDISGKYVIQDEIETVSKYGEGFVEGYWPNPIIPADKGSLQYSFVKKFAPLDWLIGTGEFLNNVEQELQQETLEWLSKIRFSQGSYIFADTYKGDALLMDGKLISEPLNIWELEDPNGIKVIQEETRIAKSQPEGGFLHYLWRRENGRDPIPVISFVKAVPEWEWILGSSIYLEDLEKEMSAQQARLRQNVQRDISFIIIGFILSIPLITLASIFVTKGFKKEIDVFLSFFKKIQNRNVDIDLSTLNLLEFKELGEAANHMIACKRDVEEKLDKLSRTDSLTGLSNRRDALEKLSMEAKRASRQETSFAVVLADIDQFKNVNDEYGHDAGDSVLSNISVLLKESVRATDSIARWGGEEFLFILPDTDTRQATILSEKVREKIQHSPTSFNDITIRVTMTFGVAEWSKGVPLEKVLSQADSNLYKGKRSGRNSVIS